MSCGCSSDPASLAEAPASVASQLEALTAALFGTVTQLVVDGRVTWTGTCSASLPFIIAGVAPLEGEGLLCYLIRALKEVPGVVLPGILTFANEAARNTTAPQFVGQIGSQQDTHQLYVATGIVAGDWDAAVGGTGTQTFANASARALAVPLFIGQFGSQLSTGEVYVATGLLAGNWTLALAGSAGAFLQDNFTGTGAQTAFTLTRAPGSIVNTWVFVDGIYQNKTTAYGVSGSTLTFTEAPATGAEIQVVVGTLLVTSIVPDDLSVTTAKLAATSVTEPKLADAAVNYRVVSPDMVLQVKRVEKKDHASYTAVIPVDNTVPEITEGSDILTLTFAPLLETSRLLIRVVLPVVTTSGAINASMALFQGSTCIGAALTAPAGANYPFCLTLEAEVLPGSTSGQVYSVRFGPASNTAYLNGYTTRVFGGVAAASMVITEVKV